LVDEALDASHPHRAAQSVKSVLIELGEFGLNPIGPFWVGLALCGIL
jgi:hypothetical protein